MRVSKTLTVLCAAGALLAGGVTATALATADRGPAPTAQPAADEDGEFYAPVSASDIAQPWTYDAAGTANADKTDSSDALAARTATQAINWYKSRKGSAAYEGYCEKAARLSWNRSTHHASAIEHWRSSDGARHTKGTPPKGAFVFWNISQYGHIGVADGNGGFWATDVNSHIGHATSVHYFSNYLGWKPGNSK
jgi:hypothetical protein